MGFTSYQFTVKLYNYIIGKNNGGNIPPILRDDPVIQHLRKTINEKKCPFCGRRFYRIKSHISKGQCHEALLKVIDLTIDRYMMIS